MGGQRAVNTTERKKMAEDDAKKLKNSVEGASQADTGAEAEKVADDAKNAENVADGDKKAAENAENAVGLYITLENDNKYVLLERTITVDNRTYQPEVTYSDDIDPGILFG